MSQPVLFRRRLAGAAAFALSSVLITVPALAQAGGAETITVSAAPLGDALRAFSVQTGVPVIFTESLVKGRSSSGVDRAAGPDAALAVLLTGTNLEAVAGGGGYVIRLRASQEWHEGAGKADAAPAPERTAPQTANESGEPEEADLRIDRVTVTGTSLKGIAPESSPLQVYSREDILGSGVTTTEQFIRTLPQNFGGGASEFARNGLPNDDNAVQNYSFGTGANLRGLGSGGTLVLLDGRRLAPTSAIADFVDLSMIPVSALERVDVLTDGASSIYGGDAVAGVLNFVLRDDFDGAETSARYGAATSGGLEEYRLSQTLGTSWESGNVLGTYEYFKRGNLTLADRPEIEQPRLANGGPIPSPERFDLIPAQKRQSLLLAANQDVSPALRLSASGLYSQRSTDHFGVNFTGLGVLVSSAAESESIALGGGAVYDLDDNWSVSLDANYSRIDNKTSTLASNTALPSAFDFRSDVQSGDIVLNGSLFRLPGGPVQMAAGGHLRRETFTLSSAADGLLRKGDRTVSAIYGEILLPVIGADNAIAGAERIELSLSGRLDDYSDFGQSANPKVGLLWAPSDSWKLRTSYSQSFMPPALGYTGDRSSTGAILPTSFVLGALGLSGQYPELAATDLLIVSGVAEDLRPQTSETFTAGAEYAGDWNAHSWSARLDFYDISFSQRLGTVPIPGNLSANFAPFIAYDDTGAFPAGTVIFFPSPAEVAQLVGGFDLPVEPRLGATVENVGIINNASVRRNLASTRTRGLDLQLDYETDTTLGTFSGGVNANYILDFNQQASVTTPEIDVLSTLFNPVGLQARGQIGLLRGGFNANLTVNYTDGYRSDSTPLAVEISSWTTSDLVLSYDFGGADGSWLNNARVGLSVINLFDTPPPRTPTLGRLQIPGYDPANASPLGRFVALELSKSF